MAITKEDVLAALSTVVDPDRKKDVVRLDMIKNLSVAENEVSFTVLLKNPSREFARQAAELCREAVVRRVGSGITVSVNIDSEMIDLGDDVQISGGAPAPSKPGGVRNFIAVASGKGGVGKSTVAVNLAIALRQQGYDVGLMDADIYGPSVPTMFGISGEKPRVNENRKIIPLEKFGIRLLSMGFLVDPSQAMVWRGPMVSSACKQFLGDTDWGDLDFLVLDMPPGTGDIQLTIVQTIPLTGAVIVSTPQEVALADARKGIAMFKNVNVPVLGIVENMSYFSPPDLPDRKYYLFGRGGAQRLAGGLAVPFLAEIPIEEAVREGGDDGKPIVLSSPESKAATAFTHMAMEVVRQVTIRNAELPPTQPVQILYR